MLWLLVVPVFVLLYATLVERFWFAVRKSELAILPKGSPDITVLHISDIHMAPWQHRKQKWIGKLGQLNPDLLINTGDNLGHAKAIPALLKSLEGLGKVPGVFVNGSNDLFAPSIRNPFGYLAAPSKTHSENHGRLDTDLLIKSFASNSWVNLNNATSNLTMKGVKICFIGTDDAHENLADLSAVNPAIDNSDLIVGVTHAPYIKTLTDLNAKGAQLIFAGHTHGGQVCWPLTGKALTTNCDLPTKYARGLFKLELNSTTGFWLNVCAGLGNSIFAPIRFACRPEVRFLTLKAMN